MFLVRFDGSPCGLVALADIDLADRIAMVWYLLGNTTHAAKGITTVAVGSILRVAFSELDLAAVHAATPG